MIVKPGASIDNCGPEILRAAIKAEHLFTAGLVITSGSEHYEHSANRSAHYRGDAIDTRSKNHPGNKHKLVFQIQNVLGADYVVILEGEGELWEHIHIHWSPIYHET